jgi:cytochrome b
VTNDGIKVWDPLVRLFHWSAVACVATAWLTAEDFRSAHEWAGYAVVGLVTIRSVWGLAGSRYARFSQFVRGPGAVFDYGKKALAGHAPRYLGHNPAGGWMVLALMLTLVALGVTGWMMTIDAFFGNDSIEGAHELLANGLLLLIGVHVSGVLITGYKHSENLVRAMVTGTKRKAQAGDVP